MIVLDANILVRAALGSRVANLLERYGGLAKMAAPVTAFDEANRHVPFIVQRKRLNQQPMRRLEKLADSVAIVETSAYARERATALERLRGRDPDDWPVLAAALTLDCPIWTEDYDFFGAGVATWTSDRVEIYLKNP